MKDEVTLEQALELLMEDQPVHVFNEDGDDYFFGYKSAINEEEPVPHLVVTGIFANTEALKDVDHHGSCRTHQRILQRNRAGSLHGSGAYRPNVGEET